MKKPDLYILEADQILEKHGLPKEMKNNFKVTFLGKNPLIQGSVTDFSFYPQNPNIKDCEQIKYLIDHILKKASLAKYIKDHTQTSNTHEETFKLILAGYHIGYLDRTILSPKRFSHLQSLKARRPKKQIRYPLKMLIQYLIKNKLIPVNLDPSKLKGHLSPKKVNSIIPEKLQIKIETFSNETNVRDQSITYSDTNTGKRFTQKLRNLTKYTKE